LDYTQDELRLFTLWYQKAYAKYKRKPAKLQRELYDKLIVDIRELEKDDGDDTDMGDVDLG